MWWAGQWLWCLFERRNRGSKKLSNLHKVTEQVRRRSTTKLRSSDSQPQGLPVLFLCLLPTTAAQNYVSLLFLPISLPFSLQVTNDFLCHVWSNLSTSPFALPPPYFRHCYLRPWIILTVTCYLHSGLLQCTQQPGWSITSLFKAASAQLGRPLEM